jgi:uncharacterized protein YjbJ (UPF0337 family)
MKRSTRNRIAGAAKEMKGRAKTAMGKITRSRRLQTEGRLDVARGKAQKTAGNFEKGLGEDFEESEF